MTDNNDTMVIISPLSYLLCRSDPDLELFRSALRARKFQFQALLAFFKG